MKQIKSSVEVLKQDSNPIIQIANVARTCYKSENEDGDIQKDINLFNNLVSKGHTAMLEHVNFIFEILPNEDGEYPDIFNFKYLRYTNELINGNYRFLMSGNVRALNETNHPLILMALRDIDPLLDYTSKGNLSNIKNHYIKLVENICDLPNYSIHELHYHTSISAKFIVDRGITHELVRHRVFSFAQESSRYCNYSNDKFGNELTFIEPSTYTEWSFTAQLEYERGLAVVEETYLNLIESGLQPQQARAILPNSLKSELIMTGTLNQWSGLFKLRCDKNAHPDIQVVSFKLLENLTELGYYKKEE